MWTHYMLFLFQRYSIVYFMSKVFRVKEFDKIYILLFANLTDRWFVFKVDTLFGIFCLNYNYLFVRLRTCKL